MNLSTEIFAHFLHIALVIGGLSAAAVMHTGLLLMRSARDTAALRPWPRVIASLELALPLTALGILLTGAWLLDLNGEEFGWDQGWVIASLTGLLAVEAAGASLARRSKAMRAAVLAAPDGRVDDALRRRILDPAFWLVMHGGTAVFLAIVFVMVVKPDGLWSTVVIAVVGALGAMTGLPFTRPTGTRPPSVVDITEPSSPERAESSPGPRS